MIISQNEAIINSKLTETILELAAIIILSLDYDSATESLEISSVS